MSVINRMLQELDRRQASAASEAVPMPAEVRLVAPRRGDREWLWRIVAALMLAAACWVAWVVWQIQPGPVVTDQAFKAAEDARRNVDTVRAAQPAAPAPAAAATLPPAAVPTLAPAPAQEPKAEAPATLRLAWTIETPVKERAPAPAAAAKAPAAGLASAAPVLVLAPAPAIRPPATPGLDVPAAKVLPAPEASSPARIEKRDPPRTPAQRAELEFRRAVALLNQGRASEAEESLLLALSHERSFEPARQALIALLIDGRRADEARRHLQEALSIQPQNVVFAIVLARIFAERRDFPSALEVLNRARGPGLENAEFAALLGTLLQRTGKHREAAEAYSSSLKIDPGNGPAWVGLGISLDQIERRAEAAAAFRRALATGTLSADVRAFAEQRAQ